MTHSHEWKMDAYEPYAYCNKCSDNPDKYHGAILNSAEIERRLNAVEFLSAEDALNAADDGLMNGLDYEYFYGLLKAYAKTLRGE